jgi:hypothetical protein
MTRREVPYDISVTRNANCKRSETMDLSVLILLTNKNINVLVKVLFFFDSTTRIWVWTEKEGFLTLIWAQQWIASVFNRILSGIL